MDAKGHFDEIGSIQSDDPPLIPTAVMPYLVRVRGIEMYILMAFAQSFALYFNILTDCGFNYSAIQYFAQDQEDHEGTAKNVLRRHAHQDRVDVPWVCDSPSLNGRYPSFQPRCNVF